MDNDVTNVSNAGAQGTIHDLGALITHWAPPGERPVLWANRQPQTGAAPYPERGGIPVCFPWFGTGPDGVSTPKHGLVRDARWQRADPQTGASIEGAGASYVIDSADVGADQAWRARLDVKFAEAFSAALTITNTGEEALTYEAALHTYFAVSHAGEVEVVGLEDAEYLDAATTPARRMGAQGRPVTFTEPVDRIYYSDAAVTIRDLQWQRQIVVEKDNSANTVVWNPGEEAGATMSGVGPGRWSEFVCVETVNCREQAITLAAGESHVMGVRLRVEELG